MKVTKSKKQATPKYPNHSQLADCTRLIGVAAIGLSTMTGCSRINTTAGGMPVEPPTKTTITKPETPPPRLDGGIAVEPRPLAGVLPPPTNTPPIKSK
jgi:hypothetical protein